MGKPVAVLIGQDGNVFNLLGICSKVLEKAGLKEDAEKMSNEVMKSESYHEALTIMGRYVDIQ